MTLQSQNNLPCRIRVAVPVPIYDCFDYQVTEQQYHTVMPGMRVVVPFGRQRCIGVVVSKVPHDQPCTFKLRPIEDILDAEALIDAEMLKLLSWAAQYYFAPIGDVIQSALPTKLRQGGSNARSTTVWQVTPSADPFITRSAKQKHAYAVLQSQPHGIDEQQLTQHDIELSTLKALEKKQRVYAEKRPLEILNSPAKLAEPALNANTEQAAVIQQITQHLSNYQAYLLDGVTGSGKTEVYLQVIHAVLKQGKQVLVLVPEIGLTPQTVARFQSRFHCHIVLLHSGLNDSQRLHAWQAAQSGQADIILGTRSAIFTPMPRLGLVILDEEHDLSFKQQETFRYHTRDVALYRAHLAKCLIVLGSATPSIDSLALVQQGKMQHLFLNTRTGDAILPKVHILDAKIAKKVHGLSQVLIGHIQQCLDRQEQVLIFLNRRGYAPVLICESCAWQANCPNCDAHFTLHTQPYVHLHCHHCGTVQTKPKQCPACQHDTLKPIGMGTVKVEEGLKELFPEHDVIRVDRDSTRHVGSLEKIYQKIHQNQPLILLGTQMLAKGHHFPYVTLVAILDIDAGLLSVDFRAPERTAQMITQVSGRAGRGEKNGDVYLQTLRPDHPLLKTLVQFDYRAFAAKTLQERQSACLPPYRYSILIRSEAKTEHDAVNFLKEQAQILTTYSQNSLQIWGPIPAPMQRKAGKYHAHMLLFADHRAHLHYYTQQWWYDMLKTVPKHIKISIDVDPQELN